MLSVETVLGTRTARRGGWPSQTTDQSARQSYLLADHDMAGDHASGTLPTTLEHGSGTLSGFSPENGTSDPSAFNAGSSVGSLQLPLSSALASGGLQSGGLLASPRGASVVGRSRENTVGESHGDSTGARREAEESFLVGDANFDLMVPPAAVDPTLAASP